MQKYNFDLDKELGLKIFITPFALVMTYAVFHIEDMFVKLIMLPFVFLLLYISYSLVYVLFVDKKVKFSINYKSFIWQEFKNNILVRTTKVYKTDIKNIDKKVYFRDGSYDYMNITIELKNGEIITLSDGVKYSLVNDYEKIFYAFIFFNYDNSNFNSFEAALNKTYVKEQKTVSNKIFFIGLIKNLKRFYKLSLILFVVIALNMIVNFLSYETGFLDSKNNESFISNKAVKLDIENKREKMFFFEGYYYSLIMYHGKYIVLKQKDFNLDKKIITQWEPSNYPLIFDEIKDLPNALELAHNLNNVTFRELETWELVFKPLWFINYDIPYLYKNSDYVKKLEKYIKEKNKKIKIAKIKEKMLEENRSVKIGLTKKEMKSIKEYFVSVYVLLEMKPINKNINESFIHRVINDKYELFYQAKKTNSSKYKKPYLYLIRSDGKYINIFPNWAEKQLEILAKTKEKDKKVYFELMKQKIYQKLEK